MSSPHSAHHLSPQIVGVSPAARDTPWHRWYSSPGGFPSEIATCPQRLFVCLFFLETSLCRRVIFGEQKSLRQVPLSAYLPCMWTNQPDSCRRCHLATLLMRMRGSSVFPPTAVCSQHAPCVPLRWHRGCAKKQTNNTRTSSTLQFPLAWKLGGGI